MTAATHPAWCDRTRCTTAGDGIHESDPKRIARRRGGAPRVLVHLVAPRDLRYTNVRVVIIGDAVTVTELDLDGADLLAATLKHLTRLAVPASDPPPHEGWPIGTRQPL